MREKGRGNIQGVALSKGSKSLGKESSYAGYKSGKAAKNYAGQDRAKAARSLKRGD